MSAIEHLLPWAQQPQGRFRLLRDSPLFGALSLVALPNHGPRNLVSGYLGAYYGAPLLNAGPGGLELDSSMGGRNRLRLSPEFTSSSTPQAAIYDVSVLSALVITYQTGTENADFALGRMNGSGSPGWAVGLHSGTSNGPAAQLGSFSLGGFSGGYRRSEPTVVLLTGDGSTARVYENGAEVSSGSYTAPYYEYSAFDGRSVLMGGSGDGGASQCRTSLGLFWSGRVIPPAVAALLTSPAEVWRLLVEPRRIWVPVAAGGGGSWSVSLTETASASDSLGAATTALVSLIESASAADIITAATIAAVALTEAASASDTQTASYSATGSGSVTESASASDALTAANTMLRALTETASADEQLAAATTMLRAISESASAVDTPAASYSGAGTATIEELTSATDALTAAATLLVTILEAGNADDALQAATTMVRAITEQATAADEVAASQPIIASVSITELATAIDVLIGELAGGAWVAGDGLMSKPRIGMARNGDLYSLVLDDDGIPVACKRMGTSRLLKLRALPGGNQAQVMVETGVVLVVL